MGSNVRSVNVRFLNYRRNVGAATYLVLILGTAWCDLNRNYHSVLTVAETVVAIYLACLLVIYAGTSTTLDIAEGEVQPIHFKFLLAGRVSLFTKTCGWQDLHIIYLTASGLYCEIGDWEIFVPKMNNFYQKIVAQYGEATRGGPPGELSGPIWSPAVRLSSESVKNIRTWLFSDTRSQAVSKVMTELGCDTKAASQAINDVLRASKIGLFQNLA